MICPIRKNSASDSEEQNKLELNSIPNDRRKLETIRWRLSDFVGRRTKWRGSRRTGNRQHPTISCRTMDFPGYHHNVGLLAESCCATEILNLDHLHNRSRRSYDIESTVAWHESQITHPHKPDRLVVKDITADLSSRAFCLLIPSGIAPRRDYRPDFGERVPFGQRATRFLDQCGSGMAQRSMKIRHLIYAAMGTRGTAGRRNR